MATLRRNKGLTLAELLVTVTLVAIMVGLGWPVFRNMVTKDQNRDAYRILDAIRLQQKSFHLTKNTYVPPAGGSVSNIDTINAMFGADLTAGSYLVFLSSNGLYGSQAKFRAQ